MGREKGERSKLEIHLEPRRVWGTFGRFFLVGEFSIAGQEGIGIDTTLLVEYIWPIIKNQKRKVHCIRYTSYTYNIVPESLYTSKVPRESQGFQFTRISSPRTLPLRNPTSLNL